MTILIDDFAIEEIDYAIRGNTLLGIKETGKTYGAMWFAERLMDDGIPIVAIDPSGVWRYLQVGKDGHPGYPVVVVGDNADLPLSVDTAGNIMRAAMEEGVSVVFDLFSPHLSKSDWRRIVTDVATVLLFDNLPFGVRHVFLEEAKDYVPQNVYDKLAYSAVEKLMRVGGNAKVGITLISQRAEGINKEVLELCEGMVLFKQTGRNSITNVAKWLAQMGFENQNEILNSIHLLGKGHCWYIDENHPPALLKIPEKKTIHPDRRASMAHAVPKISVDVSSFVARMNKSLHQQEVANDVRTNIENKRRPKKKDYSHPPTRPPERIIEPAHFRNTEDTLRSEIEALREQLEDAEQQVLNERTAKALLQERLDKVTELLNVRELSRILLSAADIIQAQSPVNGNGYWQPWLDRFGNSGSRRALELLIKRKRATPHQIRMLANIGSKRTTSNVISALVSAGLVRREGSEVVLREVENA